MNELIEGIRGAQNLHIDEIINKKTQYDYIDYKPYDKNNIDILYTNIILKKIIREEYFIWSDTKKYSNSFGKAQYYRNYKFNFEKLPFQNETSKPVHLYHCKTINKIQKTTSISYENLALTNIWVVIDNPMNLKLNVLVDTLSLGNHFYYQKYQSNDIESEINILASIFKVDGIQYKNNKILIPFILPYNGFILNDIHDEVTVNIKKKHNIVIDFTVYANICNTNVFPLLSNTTNLTHKFAFVTYQTQYTGTEQILTNKNKINLNFNHPVYVIYIMNISKEKVESIKLLLMHYRNEIYIEYKLNDIEWFDNYAIIWFNRKFLDIKELNNNTINCSMFNRIQLIIENSYVIEQDIDIVAVNVNSIINLRGLSDRKFGC
jgi:hypothetical protein